MTQWKLVPVEPENEMINAALCAVEDQQGKHLEDLLADAYTAMLNAAPAPDVQPVAWLYTYPEIEGAYACTTSRVTELNPDLVETPLYPHPVADVHPVAWRIFDGEGCYEFRSYEGNEHYKEQWEICNPKHKDWLEPLYLHPLAADVQPVAWQYKKEGSGIFVSDQCPAEVEVWNDIEWFKPLYAHPPAADVQELVEALQSLLECHEVLSPIEGDETRKARKALAKWEGK